VLKHKIDYSTGFILKTRHFLHNFNIFLYFLNFLDKRCNNNGFKVTNAIFIDLFTLMFLKKIGIERINAYK
ncbi:hypothetical protein, partial [Staphylococcus haemolyticus]|uniref:hypothetical protein n=1 Tax=Staphylococcus haemolyticus TaxID=1283 RepID=UPI001C4B8A85